IDSSVPASPVGLREAVEDVIEAWTGQHSPREVMETLQAVGVEAVRVQNARDLVDDDEHLKARGYLEEYEHLFGDRVPIEGVPFKMSLTPAHVRRRGPM